MILIIKVKRQNQTSFFPCTSWEVEEAARQARLSQCLMSDGLAGGLAVCVSDLICLSSLSSVSTDWLDWTRSAVVFPPQRLR